MFSLKHYLHATLTQLTTLFHHETGGLTDLLRFAFDIDYRFLPLNLP